MVDWMVEVLYKMDCTIESLYTSVSIMDRFISNTPTKYCDDDIHIIGISSMVIASKLDEIRPIFLE